MIRAVRLGAVLAAVLALAGCGGGFGGGSGPSAASTTGPGPAGASTFAGTTIGASLSMRDRQMALAAQNQALEYGRPGMPVQWHGRSAYGEVVPGTTYQINDYTCRDYTHTITVAGRQQVTHGTACRVPGGRWQPVG